MTKLTSLEFSQDNYPDSLINKDNLSLLTNLTSLKLNGNRYHYSFVRLEHLSRLVHLTELDTWDDSIKPSLQLFEERYGSNYSVLDHFKELKVAKLLFGRAYCFSFADIQNKYPQVRFQWRFNYGDHDKYSFENYFVGEFQNNEEFDNSNFFKKGVLRYYSSGLIYDGEFNINTDYQRHGHGILKYPYGDLYEGEFKNDQREGKGYIIYDDGGRFEGEFKNNYRDKKGVFIYPNDDRYEGEFNELDQIGGKGVMMYHDGSRYDGEWKSNMKEGQFAEALQIQV